VPAIVVCLPGRIQRVPARTEVHNVAALYAIKLSDS
jgi:hypothetical protein